MPIILIISGLEETCNRTQSLMAWKCKRASAKAETHTGSFAELIHSFLRSVKNLCIALPREGINRPFSLFSALYLGRGAM
jgi:hypothetical protein